MDDAQFMNVRTCLALLALALPLLGAAFDLGTPVVVVYPLTATGDVGATDTGSNIGTALANKLVQLGGLTVKPFIAGTARAQFLTAADSQGADYYITGYITPLGSEVSVVEQVVSTRSGSIVYSTTAFAKTYADAVGPADALREAILRHAGRGMAYLNAPPPTASPEPIADAGGVNISKAFGRHHKGAAAATASAQPQAAAAAASPAAHVALGVPTESKALIATTAGTADGAARDYASASLASALRHAGLTNEPLTVSSAEIAAHAADLCRANAADGFYAATLSVPGTSSGAGHTVQLDVVAYDCHGTVTGRQQTSGNAGKRGSLERAIDAAAARAASGFATARGPATRATPRATT
jgi:hypothetical protein